MAIHSSAHLHIASSRREIAAFAQHMRAEDTNIALVPTMGALHDGHAGLIRTARKYTSCVVASIFVNPAQFAPGEDFDHYPRDLEADMALLSKAGCACLYRPSVEDMYPDGTHTHVRVAHLSGLLDGISRPHFFHGVADAVCRLFIHVEPQWAVFGEKDYQQFVIVERMTRDLGFPVQIVSAPTVRTPGGLALSSRNAYLTPEETGTAHRLHAVLSGTARTIAAGSPVAAACANAEASLLADGFTTVDYVTACDARSLAVLGEGPLGRKMEARLLGAAWIGRTRLIDNLALARG